MSTLDFSSDPWNPEDDAQLDPTMPQTGLTPVEVGLSEPPVTETQAVPFVQLRRLRSALASDDNSPKTAATVASLLELDTDETEQYLSALVRQHRAVSEISVWGIITYHLPARSVDRPRDPAQLRGVAAGQLEHQRRYHERLRLAAREERRRRLKAWQAQHPAPDCPTDSGDAA